MTIFKFYQSYRFYIFPIIVALSSLFLTMFVIYPQTVKLIEGQKTVGDLTDKTNFLGTKVAALETYDSEDLSRKVKFALQAYPADKDIGNILGLLQQLVAESGFTVTSISLGSGGKTGSSDSFAVTLEVKGSRILLQSLLNNLDNSPRLIRLSSIEVSSNQTEAVNASLVVEILYGNLPQSFGTVDSAVTELSQKDEELLSSLERATLERTSKTTEGTSAIESPKGKSNPFE